MQDQYKNHLNEAEKIIEQWFFQEAERLEKEKNIKFGESVFDNKTKTGKEKVKLMSLEEHRQALKITHPFEFKFELRGYKLNQNGEVTGSVRKIEL